MSDLLEAVVHDLVHIRVSFLPRTSAGAGVGAGAEMDVMIRYRQAKNLAVQGDNIKSTEQKTWGKGQSQHNHDLWGINTASIIAKEKEKNLLIVYHLCLVYMSVLFFKDSLSMKRSSRSARWRLTVGDGTDRSCTDR